MPTQHGVDRLTATHDTSATPGAVWDAMADGWTYSQWVVGNSRMRAVDTNWPAEGTSIRHSIGVWPAVIDDETRVLHCRAGEELVLLAKLGVFGAARITLQLSAIDDGCRITMIETPESGPMRLIPDRVALAATYPRNVECLRRLASLAEGLEPHELE